MYWHAALRFQSAPHLPFSARWSFHMDARIFKWASRVADRMALRLCRRAAVARKSAASARRDATRRCAAAG